MVRYGIIEDGVLRTREIEAFPEHYQETENGIAHVKVRTVTVEEQAVDLEKQGWKPLDAIDESKLECEEGFAIRAEAVEYDDHIGYVYKKVINAQYYRNKIQELKEELANTDYQVLKCYEAKVMGLDLPYDTHKIHEERQRLRDSINSLEDLLDSILKEMAESTTD